MTDDADDIGKQAHATLALIAPSIRRVIDLNNEAERLVMKAHEARDQGINDLIDALRPSLTERFMKWKAVMVENGGWAEVAARLQPSGNALDEDSLIDSALTGMAIAIFDGVMSVLSHLDEETSDANNFFSDLLDGFLVGATAEDVLHRASQVSTDVQAQVDAMLKGKP